VVIATKAENCKKINILFIYHECNTLNASLVVSKLHLSKAPIYIYKNYHPVFFITISNMKIINH
jgi:hypothetical protein